jgi:hypothetical protein
MKKLLLLLLIVLIPLNGCASGFRGRPSSVESSSSSWTDIQSPHVSEPVRRALEEGRYQSIRVLKTDGTSVVLQSPVLHEDTVLSGDGQARAALKDIERWQVPTVTVPAVTGGGFDEQAVAITALPVLVVGGLLLGMFFMLKNCLDNGNGSGCY